VRSAQRHRYIVGLRGSYVLSWRLMGSQAQGHASRERYAVTPHKLRLVASMGPTRPGTVIPLSHVQKFSDPGRRESSLNLTRGSDVSHAHLDPRAFRAIQLQRTRSRRRARAKIHYTQVGHTKPGHAIPIMLVIKIIDNDGNVCLRGSCAVLQELSNSQYCLFV
jgi:hypothetical protein